MKNTEDNKTTTKDIRGWVDEFVERSNGQFRTDDIWRRYNIVTRASKDAVWHRLNELVETEVVEQSGQRYQILQQEFEEMDIFSKGDFVSLKFPFKLEQYVRLAKRSIMVVGGSKDSGKTAFLLNTAIMNMEKHIVIFHDSESGEALLYERITAIDPNIPNPLPFKIVPIMEHFDHLIRLYPDAVHIIDYLDMDSEVYMVGAEMKKMLARLREGVVIVGLQKPPGRDLPYGGPFSVKKAQVVVVLDSNVIKITHAKSRTNSIVNPVNKQWTFILTNAGTKFDNIQGGDGYEEPEKQRETMPF